LGNVALYTHLSFTRLLYASGFKCTKKKQISSNTSEQSRERRERERAGERKDGWEIERVGGLGCWIPDRYHGEICEGGEIQGLFSQMSCVATDGKHSGFFNGKLGLSSIDLLLRAIQLVSNRVIGIFER
jgi:hypothetical protein